MKNAKYLLTLLAALLASCSVVEAPKAEPLLQPLPPPSNMSSQQYQRAVCLGVDTDSAYDSRTMIVRYLLDTRALTVGLQKGASREEVNKQAAKNADEESKLTKAEAEARLQSVREIIKQRDQTFLKCFNS